MIPFDPKRSGIQINDKIQAKVESSPSPNMFTWSLDTSATPETLSRKFLITHLLWSKAELTRNRSVIISRIFLKTLILLCVPMCRDIYKFLVST